MRLCIHRTNSVMLPLRIAIALAALLLVGVTEQAVAACDEDDFAASAAPVPAETAIANLKAEYLLRLEARDAESFGCLFEHGALLGPNGNVIAEGSDAARTLIQRFLFDVTPPDLLQRRIISNPLIQVDRGNHTASAEWNLVTLRVFPTDPQPRFFRLAHYHDQCQKIGNRWWFLTSQELTDWLQPN